MTLIITRANGYAVWRTEGEDTFWIKERPKIITLLGKVVNTISIFLCGFDIGLVIGKVMILGYASYSMKQSLTFEII